MIKPLQVGFIVATQSCTNNKDRNSRSIKAKTMTKNKGPFKSAKAVFESKNITERKEIKIMRQAIIYCRSTEVNNEEIKSQKDSLKRFAKKHDIKIIKVFTDNGYNGRSYDRPGFKDAIKHLKDNRNDILLIYRFSTLSESQIDLQSILETFRVKNVRIMTFKEKFSMNI